MNKKCRVCRKQFNSYFGFKSHVSSEYKRFEKLYGRRAMSWEEIVAVFNGVGFIQMRLPT